MTSAERRMISCSEKWGRSEECVPEGGPHAAVACGVLRIGSGSIPSMRRGRATLFRSIRRREEFPRRKCEVEEKAPQANPACGAPRFIPLLVAPATRQCEQATGHVI